MVLDCVKITVITAILSLGSRDMLHQVAKGYMWLRLLRWLLIPDHWGWPGVTTVALEERGETELEQGLGGVRLVQRFEWRMEKRF